MNTGPLHVRLKSRFMSLLSGVDVTLPRMLFKQQERERRGVEGRGGLAIQPASINFNTLKQKDISCIPTLSLQHIRSGQPP